MTTERRDPPTPAGVPPPAARPGAPWVVGLVVLAGVILAGVWLPRRRASDEHVPAETRAPAAAHERANTSDARGSAPTLDLPAVATRHPALAADARPEEAAGASPSAVPPGTAIATAPA